MKYEIPDELVKKILQNAKCKVRCFEEDFGAIDFSGGNFDDAWGGGFQDGEVSLSQELEEYLLKPVE